MSALPPATPDRGRHVIICNERLLPRFGVDRVLLRLGGGLIACGYRVTFICARCDRAAVESVSPSIVELPELWPLDIHEGESRASRWLSEHWAELSVDDAPVVVVTGGWPFYGVARVCCRRGVPSLFIDAGAVPHDGMDDGVRSRQRELRRVRAGAMPLFTRVLPVSNFIRDSQTLPDRGTAAGVQTVLHGANHLDEPVFGAVAGGAVDVAALSELRKLVGRGQLPIILLGRFEAGGYKNSQCAYDVLARVLRHEPNARLLVLAQSDELVPPLAVEHAVVPTGYVSDAALNTIMQTCCLGLSVSLWEGFNLPLAEMQWAGRPVLAFNIGAHPEVSLDPWLLCGSIAEMADKVVRLLREELPPHLADGEAFARFRERFQWHDKIARYGTIIETLTTAPPMPVEAVPSRRLVLVDCTNAAVDPANPGVIRVCRRLGQALQQFPSLFLLFIRWDLDTKSYRILTAHERATLSSYEGPVDGMSLVFSQGGQGVWPLDNIVPLFENASPPLLFLPEVVLDGRMPERLLWARARGMAVGALLHDIIPITHRVLCSPNVVARFPEYIEGLAACDAIWANSGETLRQFERYVTRHSLPLPPERMVVRLPAQFGAELRATAESAPPAADEILVLCISSIQPRKNHRNLIEAFRAVLARRPDLPLRLVLVGHRFERADAMADWVESVVRDEPRIGWTGLLPDAELAALIRRCTFTVYPSLVEGFGLPVVESLWLGRPCICHNDSVMADLAIDGGCYTVDMSDSRAISQAIETLADDDVLRQQLMEQALRRRLSDWAAYGAGIAERLRGLRIADPLMLPPLHEGATADARPATLRQTLRHQAMALRELPQRFVRVTDVPVTDWVDPA
jgi:glycosyltransferase involved in cell wall biosynthesis